MKFSVVIPFKDEESNIVDLVEELEPVMKQLGEPWELVCIDDGSVDQTLQILSDLAKEKPYLSVLAFDCNYGQSSAFDAGFRTARGQFVVTLDGDRQNNPRDIPALVQAMEDTDLVCGIRTHRQDTRIKKMISFFANRIRSWVCQDGIQDTGCSLKVYRKTCLDQIKMFHGMHRFLPALFKIEGFRIKQIPVDHRPRVKGKSKYHLFNRSFNTISDMLAVAWMRKRNLNYKIKNVVD